MQSAWRHFCGRRLMSALLIAGIVLLIICLSYTERQSSKISFSAETVKIMRVASSQGTAVTKPLLQLQQLTSSGVPKFIHFIYRDTNILRAYRSALETCTKFNKDWTIVLWTDAAVEKFMRSHFPEKLKVFNSFPHKIQRSDAIRYLILYKFGGVYMDLDMVCHRPLLPVLSAFSCFIDRERQHQTQFLHNKPYYAMNSAMGCTAGHPFFRKVTEFVFHPDRLKKPFNFPGTIFITTGPAMLTNIYDQWQKASSQPEVALLNETYFSPKINPRSGIYGQCKSISAKTPNTNKSMSNRERVCMELKRLGFEKSDDLFITNRTVAIHQFTHLGYHDQKTSTFNVTRDFPQVKSYFQLPSYL